MIWHKAKHMGKKQLSLINFSIMEINKQLRRPNLSKNFNLWYDWIVPQLE